MLTNYFLPRIVVSSMSGNRLDFLNVVIGISKELGVDIPESDYGKIVSLADMISYLSGKTAENAEA